MVAPESDHKIPHRRQLKRNLPTSPKIKSKEKLRQFNLLERWDGDSSDEDIKYHLDGTRIPRLSQKVCFINENGVEMRNSGQGVEGVGFDPWKKIVDLQILADNHTPLLLRKQFDEPKAFQEIFTDLKKKIEEVPELLNDDAEKLKEMLEYVNLMLDRINITRTVIQDVGPDEKKHPQIFQIFELSRQKKLVKNLDKWVEEIPRFIEIYHVQLLDLLGNVQKLKKEIEAEKKKNKEQEEEIYELNTQNMFFFKRIQDIRALERAKGVDLFPEYASFEQIINPDEDFARDFTLKGERRKLQKNIKVYMDYQEKKRIYKDVPPPPELKTEKQKKEELDFLDARSVQNLIHDMMQQMNRFACNNPQKYKGVWMMLKKYLQELFRARVLSALPDNFSNLYPKDDDFLQSDDDEIDEAQEGARQRRNSERIAESNPVLNKVKKYSEDITGSTQVPQSTKKNEDLESSEESENEEVNKKGKKLKKSKDEMNRAERTLLALRYKQQAPYDPSEFEVNTDVLKKHQGNSQEENEDDEEGFAEKAKRKGSTIGKKGGKTEKKTLKKVSTSVRQVIATKNLARNMHGADVGSDDERDSDSEIERDPDDNETETKKNFKKKVKKSKILPATPGSVQDTVGSFSRPESSTRPNTRATMRTLNTDTTHAGDKDGNAELRPESGGSGGSDGSGLHSGLYGNIKNAVSTVQEEDTDNLNTGIISGNVASTSHFPERPPSAQDAIHTPPESFCSGQSSPSGNQGSAPAQELKRKLTPLVPESELNDGARSRSNSIVESRKHSKLNFNEYPGRGQLNIYAIISHIGDMRLRQSLLKVLDAYRPQTVNIAMGAIEIICQQCSKISHNATQTKCSQCRCTQEITTATFCPDASRYFEGSAFQAQVNIRSQCPSPFRAATAPRGPSEEELKKYENLRMPPIFGHQYEVVDEQKNKNNDNNIKHQNEIDRPENKFLKKNMGFTRDLQDQLHQHSYGPGSVDDLHQKGTEQHHQKMHHQLSNGWSAQFQPHQGEQQTQNVSLLQHHLSVQQNQNLNTVQHHRGVQEAQNVNTVQHHRGVQEAQNVNTVQHHQGVHQTQNVNTVEHHRGVQEAQNVNTVEHHPGVREAQNVNTVEHHQGVQEAQNLSTVEHHQGVQEAQNLNTVEHHQGVQEAQNLNTVEHHQGVQEAQNLNTVQHRHGVQQTPNWVSLYQGEQHPQVGPSDTGRLSMVDLPSDSADVVIYCEKVPLPYRSYCGQENLDDTSPRPQGRFKGNIGQILRAKDLETRENSRSPSPHERAKQNRIEIEERKNSPSHNRFNEQAGSRCASREAHQKGRRRASPERKHHSSTSKPTYKAPGTYVNYGTDPPPGGVLGGAPSLESFPNQSIFGLSTSVGSDCEYSTYYESMHKLGVKKRDVSPPGRLPFSEKGDSMDNIILKGGNNHHSRESMCRIASEHQIRHSRKLPLKTPLNLREEKRRQIKQIERSLALSRPMSRELSGSVNLPTRPGTTGHCTRSTRTLPSMNIRQVAKA